MRHLVVLFTVIMVSGCGILTGGGRFDRGAMLENLSASVAIPLVSDAATQSEILVQRVYALRDDPTEETVESARVQWLITSLAWERNEIVSFGAEMSLLTQIDKWPSNENFIEEFIAGDALPDRAFVAGVGSTSKGLPAIEFLLFGAGQTSVEIGRGLRDGQRMTYLVGAAETARDNMETQRRLWASDGEGYGAQFATAEQDDGDLQSSVSMSVNEMVVLLEGMIQKELAIPLGSKSYGEPFPTAAEGWRSLSSTANLLANLEGARQMFTGAGGSGFDDYLDALDAMHGEQLLSAAILAQFDRAEQALAMIEQPLTVAIVEDKEAVEVARDELRALLVLIKNDMASWLGVTITFNDSDGD